MTIRENRTATLSRHLASLILLILAAVFGGTLSAQSIVGSISGSVTDSTGAVVPGATQFVTTPRYLDLLDQKLSKDWYSRNVEIVLKSRVIEGKTGVPSMEAVYVG